MSMKPGHAKSAAEAGAGVAMAATGAAVAVAVATAAGAVVAVADGANRAGKESGGADGHCAGPRRKKH